MFGFTLHPIEYFVVCQVWIIALFDLFDFACLNLNCGCLPKIILLVAFIYFDNPQKYLFKNTTFKFYIWVLRKPLCILYFILSQKNYSISLFEKWHFNKPHMFY